MPINKIVAGFDEAVADIPDGATIMHSGFGTVATLQRVCWKHWPVRG